jgi:hypothetical protein
MADLPNMMKFIAILLACMFAASILAQQPANSDDQAAELAKKLSNPVAALISVPFKATSSLAMDRTTTAFAICFPNEV